MKAESILVEQVARYLQVRYPKVIYRFDLAADLKLTMGQASRHKRLHPRRGYPDLFIASVQHGRLGGPESGLWCPGLFIELKADGARLKKRDGSWASEHIAEQSAVHEELRKQGYMVEFAVGFDRAVEVLDQYLGNPQAVMGSTAPSALSNIRRP